MHALRVIRLCFIAKTILILKHIWSYLLFFVKILPIYVISFVRCLSFILSLQRIKIKINVDYERI